MAIARALANNPAILLLDEPFGALDAQTRALRQELLTSIWEELHEPILFVTHDVEEAIYLSDRVFVMTARPGRIKAEIDITLERPRSYELKATERFLTLKRQALTLIREEAIKATRWQGYLRCPACHPPLPHSGVDRLNEAGTTLDDLHLSRWYRTPALTEPDLEFPRHGLRHDPIQSFALRFAIAVTLTSGRSPSVGWVDGAIRAPAPRVPFIPLSRDGEREPTAAGHST